MKISNSRKLWTRDLCILSVIYSKYPHKFPERKQRNGGGLFHRGCKGILLNIPQALVFYWSANAPGACLDQTHRRCNRMPTVCSYGCVLGVTTFTMVTCMSEVGGGGSVTTPTSSVVCFISKAWDGSCEQSYYHLLLIYSWGLILKFLKARG